MPQFPVLLVDEVDEVDLCSSAAKLDTAHLPQCIIKTPISKEDVEVSAILSWRWDTDLKEPSRNLKAALRVARHLKKRYLFIDIVSIQQNQPKNNLMHAIATYSELYQQILVISAYEKDNVHLHENMLRPWIVHECTLLRSNPYGVVYASHGKLGGPLSREEEIQFRYNVLLTYLEDCCKQGYGVAAILVLTDVVGMTDIGDFQYLLPKYAKALQTACGQMTRNDYLLTVALLSQKKKLNMLGYKLPNPTDFNLEQYSMDRANEERHFYVVFSGVVVAELRFGDFERSITPWPAAIPTILRSLGHEDLISNDQFFTPGEASKDFNHELDVGLVWVDLEQPATNDLEDRLMVWHQESRQKVVILPAWRTRPEE